MSLKVYQDTTIYVVSAAHSTSGGPEALHQLHFKLKQKGFATDMFYVEVKGENPVAPRYQEYDVTYSTAIEDSEQNIIIVPEVYTEMLSGFKNIRKAIWWLSIDNFFKVVPKRDRLLNSLKRKVFGSTCARYSGFPAKVFRSPEYFHFAQSLYAHDFLAAKGIRQLYFLSDYLTADYLKDMKPVEKENWVVYNPVKGIKNTMVLMQARPDIQWVPLQNMTLDQVKGTLAKSKVYIDFGHHPGKDRLPREAAVNGCCIITGKEGSAGNAVDVAIPDQFKFEKVQAQKDQILSLIEKCFDQYASQSKSFTGYVEKIKGEEKHFEEEISFIFSR